MTERTGLSLLAMSAPDNDLKKKKGGLTSAPSSLCPLQL